ncbi:MAG: HAD family phosphatase [Clostridia bacterium]|nr:HAD family phosphatase [Clostridia bacterium]
MYILGSDYDGTLRKGGISERNREAIAAFRAAGNLFGVVTGRDAHMCDSLEEEKLPVDFVLAFNGAMLINTAGSHAGEVVFCVNEKNDGQIRWVAEHVGKVYGSDMGCVLYKKRTVFHGLYPDGTDRFTPISLADGMTEYTQLNTWCKSEEETKRCIAEIKERWGDTINPLQNGVCIDMPPVGVDKGTGMARYADLIGVPHDHVFCAGDNMNDYAMISRFHGCAVENAVPELKAAAEAVFPDVADIIEHILSL